MRSRRHEVGEFERKRRSVTLTFAVAMAAACAIIALGSYAAQRANVTRTADDLLPVIMVNGGVMPPSGVSAYDDDLISREAPYESRYAYVEVVDGSPVIDVKALSIPNNEVAGIARSALEARGGSGYVGHYRYLRAADSSAVAILDRGRQLSASRLTSLDVLVLCIILAVTGTVVVHMATGRLLSPIAEVYERQRAFTANAGHDLKTPIAIIRADADVCEMDVGHSEWLDDIRSQADRMTALVTRFTRMAAIGAKKGASADMVRIVTEEAGGMASLAREAGKPVDVTIAETSQDIVARADETEAAQVVRALLDNAVKYGKDGCTIGVLLANRSRRGRAECVLRVTNASDLAPCTDTSRWFDRLWQADDARTHADGSYGLGLAFVRDVTEGAGGSVTAEVDGTGHVTLEVRLPFAG